MVGKVIIAGGGPGDEGLLTLRCIEALRSADVVIYDRLIPRSALNYVRQGAQLIYAGKEPGRHTMEEDEIIRIMISEAGNGKTVVRLHGGDAFLFGRGFEECVAVLSAGIPCEVIPGVTSAIAAPEAYLIPPVLRGVSSSVAIVTGTEDPRKGRSFVNFRELAKAVNTIIILMGASRIGEIARELIEGGLDPGTYVAVITRAYMENSKVVITTVDKLSSGEVGVENPSVIVVGDVVREGLKAMRIAGISFEMNV
ncbi:uroporphyrinogen-III C-methyltransferase [Vulcanisaeta distributa]|uniref:uroporphyrinogen-III C-methyltransferase n=1 Tax=Vulcanisaeta distributa (strain DSM 14429 / JCM 11212 / NBRC 100878 / IC-017) TaxID=572478 RepID=E1QQ42_VULDI|nr:uroporphyrinogen-III C-methyltransferase [Vulcanisaeta distributa]ADN50414.1 uroporphyrin-III C-methyltransferase [Vulcanisaeta distributa DSM 14429]